MEGLRRVAGLGGRWLNRVLALQALQSAGESLDRMKGDGVRVVVGGRGRRYAEGW